MIDVRGLSKNFRTSRGTLNALHDVSLKIEKGQTLALVGESGSGKSTFGRCLIRLIEPDSGSISFDGVNLLALETEPLRQMRRRMQMIFQDPFSSLNPRMRVEDLISEPLRVHGIPAGLPGAGAKRGPELTKRVAGLLDLCGLPREALAKFPHEFSGGQRQRICIARALTVQPEFLVCDEPVSALDVSIQAQILNLLVDLQKEFSLTYLFISHDLRVVEYLADSMAVMYLGEIVESGAADKVFGKPRHPYTQALLSAVPKLSHETQSRIRLSGEIPSGYAVPPGCRFHTRCPNAQEICRQKAPERRKFDGDSVETSCHFVNS